MNINDTDISYHSDDKAVIHLNDVTKTYKLYNNRQDRIKEALHPIRKRYHREFNALTNINLEIRKGEILGIVGRNGSGKSTLLKIIARILTPSSGTVSVSGKIVPLIELGAGFNPDFTGIENIYFYCSLLGFNRKQTDELVDDILEFSELGDFINQPLNTYSSGMKAKLAFSVSINIDPDILILDEVFAVGDELFRRKCYARMSNFFNSGKTIVLVSHSAGLITELCTSAILLENGQIKESGDPKDIIMSYRKRLFSPIKKEKVEENVEKRDDEALAGKKDSIDGVKYESEIDETYYIDGFVSKNAKYNKYYDVDLYDIEIISKHGKKVNILLYGEAYTIRYKFQFNTDVSYFSTGMTIQSVKGVNLFGGRYPDHNDLTEKYSQGDAIIVERSFRCILSPGNYFVNIGGYSLINGEDCPLVEKLDAYVFKVDGDSLVGHYAGLVVLENDRKIVETKKSLPANSNPAR